MKKLLFLILLLSTVSFADENNGVFLKGGFGLDSPGSPPSFSKLLSTGVQKPFFWLLDYQLEGGVFSDINPASPNTSAFFGPSIGVSIVERYYYLKLFTGPSVITSTDSRLGGLLEFNNDIEVGIRDSRGLSIGLDYKHMSSAGIYDPNSGRDWLLLKVQFPLGGIK